MSKVTSLSAQLKRLQVPHTNLLNNVADKKRVSFLYDPKEAANLDSEAVYCLAINGLEQLKSIDQETFESFELTLFNSTTITFERAIQTKQVNEKLNSEIRRFLIHLSPYFMLKPAHKAFEWLVYRYQIHNYNMNELFMCLLPYHETNYFVRALQMLNLEENINSSKDHHLWSWLAENQKNGVHLAASTLATHAFSDLSFFNFLIEYVSECLQQFADESRAQTENQQKIWMNGLNFCFSFITKTLLQAIKQLSLTTTLNPLSRKNQNNKQQELFFAQLLPFLFDGFKSDIIPYKQSSYLIASFLFRKFFFTTEITNKAMFALCKGLSTFRIDKMEDDESEIPNGTSNGHEFDQDLSKYYDNESLDCIKSSILAICLIIQSQYDENNSISLLNKNSLKKLFKNFSLPQQANLLASIIDNLNETYKIDKFLRCLCSRLFSDLVEHDKQNEKALNGMDLDLDMNNDEDELRSKGKNVYFDFLASLISLTNLNRTPALVESLIDDLFHLLIKQIDNFDNNNNNASSLPSLLVEFHLCELIYKFEHKYPSQFDACLNKLLNSTDGLNKKQRNYFLTTISCKFTSLKCKSTFKYQQISGKGSETSDLNLFLSLNHANENIRANALSYMLNEIKRAQQADPKSKDKLSNQINLDKEFIQNQLELKFLNEKSPLVYQNVVEFELKLVDYFKLEQLIENESYLLKLFSLEIFEEQVSLNDLSDEMKQSFSRQNQKWEECRMSALELIFNSLYKLNTDKKDLFFNCFLIISSRLFESGLSSLIKKLKSTVYYSDLQTETHTTEPASIKKFYSPTSTSSISITKISTGVTMSSQVAKLSNGHSDDGLNELFEAFLQISAKYMLANPNKLNNLIKSPKCFDQIVAYLKEMSVSKEKNEFNKTNYKIRLLDLVAFEVCSRICTQSLFFANAPHYLNIICNILTDLVGLFANFKVKKQKSGELNEEVEKTDKKYTSYLEIVRKQTLKSNQLLLGLYQSAFKTLAIQTSNFVNTQNKIEIDLILNRIYTYLCSVSSSEASLSSLILLKFIQSGCFSSSQSPAHTPTKAAGTNGSGSAGASSFLQFAFKYLIYFDDSSEKVDTLLLVQQRTIRLLNENAQDLILNSKKYDSSVLNALILALIWCLTSKHSKTRVEALSLLESLNSSSFLSNESDYIWLGCLKKLLKHKKEIEIDGADYTKTKSFSKLFTAEDNAEQGKSLTNAIAHFLTLDNKSNQLYKLQIFTFVDDQYSKLVLNEFKYCLLDLVKNLRDDAKLKLIQPVFALLISILGDASNEDSTSNKLELLNKKLFDLIVGYNLVTSKSSEFFKKDEKSFDYLIGYLNNKNQTKSTIMIRYFKRIFIEKLSASNKDTKFFQQLPRGMQHDLLKCCFDMLRFNSATSEADAQTNSAKQSILSLELNSSYFIYLLNERANLAIAKSDDAKETIGTTKEMKKQIIQSKLNFNKAEKEVKTVDWQCLKLILELIQSSLISSEDKMEIDGAEAQPEHNYESSIELIPYLFLILEKIEANFASEANVSSKKEAKTTNGNDSMEEEEDESSEKLYLYLELMCLNSLLTIYKVNKTTNKSKLDQSKFNIELLMQILQTKRDEEQDLETGHEQIDRINVQEHILLLLSEIASIFPDKVLEHVLIMFVFVGNKLARKDDSYSFQIINKIIKTILPSIVNSVNQHSHENQVESEQDKNSRLIKTVNVMQRHQKELPFVSSLVCKILQSFVVALPHIPAHRKTIIFNQLLQIIGLNEYLWITIIQSIDHYLVQSNDLLDFTNSLQQVTTQSQQMLANSSEAVSKNERKLRDTLKTSIQSMIALHIQFDPFDILKSSVYLIAFMNKYLTSLFDKALKVFISNTTSSSQKQPAKQIYSHLACRLDDYNLLQMKYLAYNLLTFVNELLVSDELISKLASIYDDKQSNQRRADYSQLFQDLLEKTLLLILKLAQVFNSFESQISQSKSSNPNNTALVEDLKKFHKAILNKSYELMEKTINLLDSEQFVNVIKRLIKHDLMQIRRRSLGLLNNKLRKYEPNQQETTLLISMIDDLLNSMQLTDIIDEKANSSVDTEINNQTILFSIKLLCKRIGEQNPLAFVKVIKFLSENLINKQLFIKKDNLSLQNVNLLSSLLLCIGEVCLKLKSNSLVYLNQIMLFTLDIADLIRAKLEDPAGQAETSLADEFTNLNLDAQTMNKKMAVFKTHEILMISCVTCLLKIVQNMSSFLSPYLPRLFYITCSLSYLNVKNDSMVALNSSIDSTQGEAALNQLKPGANSIQTDLKLTQLRSTLATLVPLRLLAPILSEESLHMSESTNGKPYKIKLKHVEYYMQIARLAIQSANQEDLLANIATLRNMFMNLFEMRSNVLKSVKVSKKAKLDGLITVEICKYENHVIDAFCEMTYKLSEDLFRPIFFRMYEWATVNSPPKDRQITFYSSTLRLVLGLNF